MRTKQFLTILALTLGLVLTLALLAGLHTTHAAPTATDRFVTPTGSGDCSQVSPCALQTALNLATNGDTIYVAEGTYTGTGTAVITLTRSITLSGGWNDLFTQHDPAAYPTTLDGEGARRVVVISGNITPTLDGFIVTRGNATGLTAHCPSNPDGCGGGIFVLNAHPLILNNTITNNVAAITTTGNPTVATGYGGGLYLISAERAVISGNVIISNAGSTAYRGSGGGMYVWGNCSGIQIQFNQVLSNAATTINSYGEGGGIYGGPDGALIQGNIIAGNRTNNAGTTGRGAGLFQYGGAAHYLGNQVQGNSGGCAVELLYSRAYFAGNRVVDNTTSGGVCLQSGSGAGPTLVNNVIARSGSRTLSVYGYNESNLLLATLIHNTLVGAGAGYGVYAQYGVLTMTNTLVASATWGIHNATPVSATVTADHTLFYNTPNHSSGVISTDEISGDPRFIDPAGGDYHLGTGSAAIDVGVDAGVTTDIDGDPRPIGLLPDIGADEWKLNLYLPLVLRNN